MPWNESVTMDERLQFVRDALSDRFDMSALCARYGVSRRIGYKRVARYEADGRRGLEDRSGARHQCPYAVALELTALLTRNARRILTGLRANSSRSSRRAIRTCHAGRRRARSRTCSPAVGSCTGASGGAR